MSAFSGSATVAGVAKPDLVAPGQSVLSLMPAGSVVARENPGSRQSDGLYRGTGTSMATAVTSGLAALFLAEHPDADPRTVKASLRSAASVQRRPAGGDRVRPRHHQGPRPAGRPGPGRPQRRRRRDRLRRGLLERRVVERGLLVGGLLERRVLVARRVLERRVVERRVLVRGLVVRGLRGGLVTTFARVRRGGTTPADGAAEDPLGQPGVPGGRRRGDGRDAAGAGPAWWAVPVLAAVVAGSELAVVHLTFGRQRYSFSCTEGALGAALVFAPGGWVALAVGLGVLAAQLVRGQPALKVQFNVAQFVAGSAAAAALAVGLGGSLGAACSAMALFWLVNHLLVGTAVALTSGRSPRDLLVTSAPMAFLHSAGNTSVGLLAAWLATNAPLGLFGLLVPMGLLWNSYDQQTRRAAEARLFAELARGQEEATGRSTDTSAQVVLTAAARLFGGADVELVLFGAEGPMLYTGDEYGVPVRRRVDPDTLDSPWLLRALGSAGISTGSHEGRPFCSAVLGDLEQPLAVLVARRASGSAAFGRRDVRLAEVLVGQAEAWLSMADLTARHRDAEARLTDVEGAARALGDLGADTVPALAVLRESAARLSRLADRPSGPGAVDDIVEELHAVERAVASLLGAIALASEPDLAGQGRELEEVDRRTVERPAGVPTPGRRATDWTTTGTLPPRMSDAR